MKIMNHPFKSTRRSLMHGFSMIEIALALAIIGIGMISILGLMGTALNVARDSNDENQIGIIVNQIVADRRSSSFNASSDLYAITNLNVIADFPTHTPIFFRKNGRPLLSSAGAYYRVRVAVSNFNAGAGDPHPAAQFNLRVEWPANLVKTNVSYFSTVIARCSP